MGRRQVIDECGFVEVTLLAHVAPAKRASNVRDMRERESADASRPGNKARDEEGVCRSMPGRGKQLR